jgi:hypothetical protein
VLFRPQQLTGRAHRVPHLFGANRLQQNRISSGLQRFRPGIVSNDCQSQRALRRLQVPRRLQQKCRLWLIVPVGDYDLEPLGCNLLDRVYRAPAVLSLDPQVGEHLPDRLDRFFVRREYEAAQGHAFPD